MLIFNTRNSRLKLSNPRFVAIFPRQPTTILVNITSPHVTDEIAKISIQLIILKIFSITFILNA